MLLSSLEKAGDLEFDFYISSKWARQSWCCLAAVFIWTFHRSEQKVAKGNPLGKSLVNKSAPRVTEIVIKVIMALCQVHIHWFLPSTFAPVSSPPTCVEVSNFARKSSHIGRALSAMRSTMFSKVPTLRGKWQIWTKKITQPVVSVRRVRILPPASFRFHLAVDTLVLG